jgi:hypothetical protein
MRINKLLYIVVPISIFIYCLLSAGESRVVLRFNIRQDRDIYEESDYGEPPQVAIWLEDSTGGALRTIYVTYRTAAGDFDGKSECPVSLPAWTTVYRREFSRKGFPIPGSSAPEAITKATSLEELITVEVEVPKGSSFRYYIEMNVAGDFNSRFPFEDESSRLDYHGNGQPSLIYRGEITAEPGSKATARLLGRTKQHEFSGIIDDLEGMDSALKCFKSIEIVCLGR